MFDYAQNRALMKGYKEAENLFLHVIEKSHESMGPENYLKKEAFKMLENLP